MAVKKSKASSPLDGQRDDDRGPRKKKKKTAAGSRWPLYAAIAAGGVFVLVLVIVVGIVTVIVGIKAIRGAPAEPVTAWNRYVAPEQEFGFDFPKGWDFRQYGIKDKREVNVNKGSASISFKENLTGSLIGDIANAANFGKDVSDDRLPVAKVHEMRKPEGAKEDPAVTVNSKSGKARRSFYSDGSRRGYRATVLLQQTALDIFCECHETDWETLRPAFERVIESTSRGG
jgi:hypothetical protein